LRRDELYLRDIVEAADAIADFLVNIQEDHFVGNDLLRSAVLQKLIMIGEAAARLAQDFKARYPEVEWADIVAFRNIAVHVYFSVQWPIVWVTATQDVPALRQQIQSILAAEWPGESAR